MQLHELASVFPEAVRFVNSAHALGLNVSKILCLPALRGDPAEGTHHDTFDIVICDRRITIADESAGTGSCPNSTRVSADSPLDLR